MERGILKIADLLDALRSVFPLEDLKHLYGNKINFIEYQRIILRIKNLSEW